jgi:GNAT superfamily N-acetyltransferase
VATALRLAPVELRVWTEDIGDERLRCEVDCDAEGRIVGASVAAPGSEEPPVSGQLASLFVEPRCHGGGTGARLATRAEDWMRDQGWGRATLNVLAGAPALGFYLAHGWERDGRTGTYEAFGLPTLGLTKRLG